MKLTKIIRLHTYKRPDGTKVNMFRGDDSGGWPVYFYLNRMKRQIVPESELRTWERQ